MIIKLGRNEKQNYWCLVESAQQIILSYKKLPETYLHESKSF